MPTKHRTIRLTDENWIQLAEVFRRVVPVERKPAHVRADSDWQITEGLRMVAKGELIISTPEQYGCLARNRGPPVNSDCRICG